VLTMIIRKAIKRPIGLLYEISSAMTKGEETRQRIIERSAALMNVAGYTAVSVSEILQAADLQKGGLYNHFASRDDVATAAFDYASDLALSRMRDASAVSGSGLERLLRLFEFFETYGRDFPIPGGCPLLNAAVESADGHPWLRQRAALAMGRMIKIVEGLLEHGKADGSLRTDIEPKQEALVLVSTLEGAVMLSNLYKSKAPIKAALKGVRDQTKRLAR
jgi:TetR/AcrR family transcriptional regulator, transcriptional repressor for nem operon